MSNGGAVGRVSAWALTIVSGLSSFLIAGPGLSAQEGVITPSTSPASLLSFALGIRYEKGKAFGQFPVFNSSGDCGLFDGGEEDVRQLSAQLRLPQLIGPAIGFAAGLNIASTSELFIETPLDPQVIHDPQSNSPVELEREYRFRSSYTTASLDLLLSWKIGSRLTFRAGPAIGYRFSGTFEQYDTVLGPDGFVFVDGATRHEMPERLPFTLRSLMVGGVVGAGFKFPVGKQLSLEPGINVRLDLLGPMQEMRRSSLGVGFGLALSYELAPSAKDDRGLAPAIVPLANESSSRAADTSSAVTSLPEGAESQATDEPLLLAGRLNASLDVYSLNPSDLRSDSAVIPMRSVHERRFVSLLPRLYFDRNAAVIPSRYPRLGSGEVSAFTVNSLKGSDPERINNRLLDVVGQRLKDNPGTSVKLSGSVSIDEPNELVEERVRSVETYLRDVWGVAASRVAVVPPVSTHDPVDNGTEEGREEQRYVGIELTPEDLAAPVIVEQIAREFSPPGIKLAPRVDSDAVLKEWEIVIRQGANEVARYTSDLTQDASSGIPWNMVAGEGDAPPATLVAELSALDKAGRKGSARDTLPVVFVPEKGGAERHERILFILPGSWGENVSKKRVENEARKMTERVQGGERIRIYPRYSGTDRFATERSLALAKALGESLIDELELKGIRIADIAIEKLPEGSDLSEADTPERRVAQRGVIVVVEKGADSR